MKHAIRVIADLLLVPFVFLAAYVFKLVRRIGIMFLPNCRNVLTQVGIYPVRNHYYEPQFDYRTPGSPFSADRDLPGVDWNVSGQLDLLTRLTFAKELAGLPVEKPEKRTFHIGNAGFGPGDAECWYQVIRAFKPRKIIEVGSGNSTLMARKAIDANRADQPSHLCEHICIEPYEMPWLEENGIAVMRKKVEDVDLSFFSQLQENDIFFIDSSHMIRPQGDVLFQFLQVLPSLNKGVIVHVHDIFTPRNYPKEWLVDEIRFWNEQYLLEAFLCNNAQWKVLAGVNYLKHHHYSKLKTVAPYLEDKHEPGSFYMQKI